METTVSGLLPAHNGFQPIGDLAAFLEALPEFGEDAARLRDAIAENRASRRAVERVDVWKLETAGLPRRRDT
jgi:hypothetical protein